MNADLKHKDLTDAALCCFYTVYNSLGYGFLEKVYMNALIHELKKLGLAAYSQVPLTVFYDQQVVGEYFADIVVENVLNHRDQSFKRNPA